MKETERRKRFFQIALQLINKKGYKAMTMRELACLLYTSPSPRDATLSRMPSSA